VTLLVVDPRDESQFRRWFGVLQRAELHRDQGRGTGWQFEEWRAIALDPFAPGDVLAWSVGGTMAAVSCLRMTTLDNLSSVRADLFVEPTLRRRGYGRALLEATEERAKKAGRREIVVYAMEGAHEVDAAPNRGFAPCMGYEVGDDSRRLDIVWPLPRATRHALRDEWQPYATDYDVVSWLRDTPDEFLGERARLAGTMLTAAPWANLEHEDEVWSPQRVRTHESTARDMGRLLMVSVARLRSSATLVAYSELTISELAPETAYQWDTLVSPEHRGHRLGGLIKLANFDLLEASGLSPRRISTFNSTVNEPMMRVNRALGGALGGAAVLWRKTLASSS